MTRPVLNLQDNFLNQVRRENLEITLILLDGSQLLGRVKGFDNFTVIVSNSTGGEHLIYKHAIAQMVADKPIVNTTPPPRSDRPEQSRPPRPAGGPRGEGQAGGYQGQGGPRPPRPAGGPPRPQQQPSQSGAPASGGGEGSAPAEAAPKPQASAPSEGPKAEGGSRGGPEAKPAPREEKPRPPKPGEGFNKLDLSALQGGGDKS
jgi:host factor-I protein